MDPEGQLGQPAAFLKQKLPEVPVEAADWLFQDQSVNVFEGGQVSQGAGVVEQVRQGQADGRHAGKDLADFQKELCSIEVNETNLLH